MTLSPDQAYKLAKRCKKYYKAYNKYWDHIHDPTIDEIDELWEDDAYKLDLKLRKAREKLNKCLEELWT